VLDEVRCLLCVPFVNLDNKFLAGEPEKIDVRGTYSESHFKHYFVLAREYFL
jgi:hypothetical protein